MRPLELHRGPLLAVHGRSHGIPDWLLTMQPMQPMQEVFLNWLAATLDVACRTAFPAPSCCMSSEDTHEVGLPAGQLLYSDGTAVTGMLCVRLFGGNGGMWIVSESSTFR